ncbi:MAG TPA: hypothetical protein PLU22_02735 [Polyangiaceae bacterium]|nr:hypothetical protein [Polyangiaceae bacterium]
MTGEPGRYPPRLVDEESAVGRLLRASLAEELPGPHETQSWAGLAARRVARRRRSATLALVAAAAAVLGVGALVSLARSPEAVSFTAEAPPTAPVTSAPTIEGPVPAVQGRHAEARRPRAASQAPSAPPSGASSASAPVDPAGDTTACANLVRERRYEEALACYEPIARGDTMSAELALYEQARLESRALGAPERALATLDAHRRRFPGGVLGAEVTLTRIELLARLGRAAEALDASASALAGPLGAERAGDLHALRGDLLADRGDCAGARGEYAAARAAAVHPARLARGEARCPVQPGANAPPLDGGGSP